ncbi:MAG: copper chaperone PCu(A)C [Burkholderiales bacterium]|jgi:copper(I)-binding protein
MLKRIFCVALFAFCLPAHAAGGAAVSGAWLRYIPGGAPAAGYFTLTNRGDKPLSLVGAECPDFGMVMIHRTIERGGISTMRPVHELAVAPGKSVAFAPGGYHLMLIRPKHPLVPGGRLPITLRFADGSSLAVEFIVKSLEAR